MDASPVPRSTSQPNLLVGLLCLAGSVLAALLVGLVVAWATSGPSTPAAPSVDQLHEGAEQTHERLRRLRGGY